jgi:hypothetical protein
MPASPDPLRAAVGRVAYYSRRGESPQKLEEARREVAAAKLERAIQDALESAPPLTTEQRNRLAVLLAKGGE